MTKEYLRGYTYSGDWYAATVELWEEYRIAVKEKDWEKVEFLETGQNPDFYYDPKPWK
jgi:uncharacterized protein YifE (UPF0438 family)